MNEVAAIILWTLLAGLAMPVGATIAAIERIRPAWLEEEFRHFVTALGGGALLSAVSLVLVPHGIEHLSVFAVAIYFLGGGISFLIIDLFLVSIRKPASQAAAMMADFIPETLALGALITTNPSVAPLLAIIICFQSLPEGFSAYREIVANTEYTAKRVIGVFILLAALGPACGLIGYYWLSGQEELLAAVMIFSGGGILYLVFQDIAPQVKLEKHWLPPLGAVLGFLIGVVALMLG